MAHVIKLKNGRQAIVLDVQDLYSLIDEMLGSEVRSWVEEYIEEVTSNTREYEETVLDYEKMIDELENHHKEVMRELRDLSETIAGLILEKRIDRKKLSAAAGEIGAITWREL